MNIARSVSLCCLALVLQTASPVEAREHIDAALVRFLATGTSIHSTWGGNQDVYLARLQVDRRADPFFAKILDEFPVSRPSIPRTLLA